MCVTQKYLPISSADPTVDSALSSLFSSAIAWNVLPRSSGETCSNGAFVNALSSAIRTSGSSSSPLFCAFKFLIKSNISLPLAIAAASLWIGDFRISWAFNALGRSRSYCISAICAVPLKIHTPFLRAHSVWRPM